ncbi:MAG: FecR family protein [Hyphomicrobiaceae bacterium]
MPDENDDLWNEAMALLLRWQRDPDNAEAREDIVCFCAASEAHLAAWESAKRLYRLTGEATGAPTRDEARRRKRELTRRGVIGGLGVVIAGTIALKGADFWRDWQADMVSDAGVITHHDLADGSKLTLGPDSAVRLAFSPTLRRIDLLDGMALFDVTDDPHRPFEARTDAFVTRVRAGASFEMRQNGSRAVVGVGSGRVRVETREGAAAAELAAGDWVAGGPGDETPRRGHRDAAQIAAWRNRQLIAEQERIDSVVAEIARWQSARIIIADWGLGASRVSGLYDLGNPEAALHAVVRPYGGRVRSITPWLTVISSV